MDDRGRAFNKAAEVDREKEKQRRAALSEAHSRTIDAIDRRERGDIDAKRRQQDQRREQEQAAERRRLLEERPMQRLVPSWAVTRRSRDEIDRQAAELVENRHAREIEAIRTQAATDREQVYQQAERQKEQGGPELRRDFQRSADRDLSQTFGRARDRSR